MLYVAENMSESKWFAFVRLSVVHPFYLFACHAMRLLVWFGEVVWVFLFVFLFNCLFCVHTCGADTRVCGTLHVTVPV